MRVRRIPRAWTSLLYAAVVAALAGCASGPTPTDPQQVLDFYDAYRLARGVWSVLPADHPDRIAAAEAVPPWIQARRARQAARRAARPPVPPREPSARELRQAALRRLTQPNCLSPCWVDRTASPIPLAPEVRFVTDIQTGAAAALFRIDDVIYVAFRGTRDGWPGSPDRAHNLMLELDPIPFAPTGRHKAHRGFLLRYLAIREPLWNALMGQLHSDQKPPREIRAVGHSAGGSAALLFAYDASTRPPLPVILTAMSFGAPRTLNRVAAGAAARAVAADGTIMVYRVTNRGDMVPAMPPSLFGYRHVGEHQSIGTTPLLGISFRAHHPGYREELQALLRSSRANLGASHSSWLVAPNWTRWPCFSSDRNAAP